MFQNCLSNERFTFTAGNGRWKHWDVGNCFFFGCWTAQEPPVGVLLLPRCHIECGTFLINFHASSNTQPEIIGRGTQGNDYNISFWNKNFHRPGNVPKREEPKRQMAQQVKIYSGGTFYFDRMKPFIDWWWIALLIINLLVKNDSWQLSCRFPVGPNVGKWSQFFKKKYLMRTASVFLGISIELC